MAADILDQLDHWSPSKFQLWDRCPVSFKDRYIDGLAEPFSDAMRFGLAIHRALEVNITHDSDAADREFRAVSAGHHLALGWALLEQVYALGLRGQPELPFKIDTALVWGLPTVGIIDLIDPDKRVVYDYKTTVGAWGQERADRDLWQPTIYQWAALQEYGEVFDFQYVVINRRTMEVSTIAPSTSFDERFNTCYDAARIIARMVSEGAFPCAGGHGKCPECGELWQHEHVCDLTVAEPRIHITRP